MKHWNFYKRFGFVCTALGGFLAGITLATSADDVSVLTSAGLLCLIGLSLFFSN
jgi:hypothetical protein